MSRLTRLLLSLLVLAGSGAVRAQTNLLPDPSIEQVGQPNQFGVPYKLWSGWLFEGAGAFKVGHIAHSGTTSAELDGSPGVKMRVSSPTVSLEPGRYRFTCWIRGLDVGVHAWGMSEDITFADEQYLPIKKSGTFGWTQVSLVKELAAKRDVNFRLGLMAAGRLWLDDAKLERVDASVPVTAAPLFGKEEAPIAPPGALDSVTAVNCPACGYRNIPAWGRCYACGAPLTAGPAGGAGLPPILLLADFEEGKPAPFTGSAPGAAEAVIEHATKGRYALRVHNGYAVWDGAIDWSGYDFFKADAYNPSSAPISLYVEIRAQATQDYWTRVNYTTVIPPGASTLVLPTDLYVGEKSRPGRPLDPAHITHLVFSVEGEKNALYFDNLRVEKDLSDSVKVPGLKAYSFGPANFKPMRGFTAVTPATLYSPGRGFGLLNAQVWRAFDVLQPDPLYENFMCIEKGAFAVDLPNGNYHVFLNLDSPSGFWGEYQIYRSRTVKANGVTVVQETMDLPRFLARYFRYSDVEDRLDENTFDKYQRSYFSEKQFDVSVTDGQLKLDFDGAVWANSVSALVIYPSAQAPAGKRYLANLQERRRFYFNNYFKRIAPDGLHDSRGAIPAFSPTAEERTKGYALFSRDWMEDVPINGVPRREEVSKPIEAFASAGQLEPLVFSFYPLKGLGSVTLSVGDLKSERGSVLPGSSITAAVVSHRLTRVTSEGTVYTIAPRLLMPRSTASLSAGATTTFWLTLHTPAVVKSGLYQGRITLKFADGKTDSVPLRIRLFATPLDPLDVAAGPWGSSLDIPWYSEDLGGWHREMYRKSLMKMREYGCTTFSGVPTLRLRGWKDHVPDIDFSQADQEMADAKELGFKRILVNYNGGIQGFDNYRIDEDAMRAAGFTQYVDYVRAMLTLVDGHARAAGWLPFAFNLSDEPIGDAALAAAANARAWREAAPPTLFTTGATSVENPKPDDPHLALAKALRVPALNGHDEPAIAAIRAAGNDWGFYNGGNRWTYGTYMYKCAKQFGMKFRLDWYWNASAGDPCYALDCREDDYAWVVTNARKELIPTLHFEREIREGIDDYRYMLTLARLVDAHPGSPATVAGRKLLDEKLNAFKLGERDHDRKWPIQEYADYRLRLAEAVEALSK